MSATDWAAELLDRHSGVLTPAQVEDTRALIADGDGWLAAYDLFRDGIDGRWLTGSDLEAVLTLARAGAFSKFSANVERKAVAALAARRRLAI